MTGLFVLISLVVGFTLAYSLRNSGPVKYYCGRKAAFSSIYGTYIYGINVVCYCIGFCCNLAAYLKAVMLKKSPSAFVSFILQ